MINLLIKFAVVGLSGVGVNMAVYMGLTAVGANYLMAAVCSFLVAVTNNFYWNLLWTFKGRAKDKSIQRKYASFFIISGINLGVNLLILRLLVEELKIDERVAQMVAIAVVSGLNFVLKYTITFRQKSNKKKGDLMSYETDCNTNL